MRRRVHVKSSPTSDPITGRGDSDGGGRFDTDMRIWPKDLRADGKFTLAALPLTLLVPLLPSVPWFEPQNSKIDASLTIRAESPARVALDGNATLRNVGLSHERLATTPVRGINMSISGHGHWLPLARRLEVDSGQLGLGKAQFEVKGSVELTSDHFAFDIDTSLPQTACTDAVRSIPHDCGRHGVAPGQGTWWAAALQPTRGPGEGRARVDTKIVATFSSCRWSRI